MKPYYSHGLITLYNADCFEVLPQIELSGGFVITDPPGSFRRAP